MVVIFERLGKFYSIKNLGLQFKVLFIDWVVGKLSLKINQLDVLVEIKIKDNVFVKLKVFVQFKVLGDVVYDVFYKLENLYEQIILYVFDIVRVEVFKLKLDDVFECKDDIVVVICCELEEVMNEYGYGIVKVFVIDIDLDQEVKIFMNCINVVECEKFVVEYEVEVDCI